MSTVLTVNAIDLLERDHREAEALFRQYETAKEGGNNHEKYEIARQVCAALLVHMEIEESIFYPAARKATGENDKLNEAQVEHAGARDLIAQLGTMQPEDPMFDAKVKVLNEQIEHHVDEEETVLFPRVRKTRLDLETLGESLEQEKNRLKTARGMQ